MRISRPLALTTAKTLQFPPARRAHRLWLCLIVRAHPRIFASSIRDAIKQTASNCASVRARDTRGQYSRLVAKQRATYIRTYAVVVFFLARDARDSLCIEAALRGSPSRKKKKIAIREKWDCERSAEADWPMGASLGVGGLWKYESRREYLVLGHSIE